MNPKNKMTLSYILRFIVIFFTRGNLFQTWNSPIYTLRNARFRWWFLSTSRSLGQKVQPGVLQRPLACGRPKDCWAISWMFGGDTGWPGLHPHHDVTISFPGCFVCLKSNCWLFFSGPLAGSLIQFFFTDDLRFLFETTMLLLLQGPCLELCWSRPTGIWISLHQLWGECGPQNHVPWIHPTKIQRRNHGDPSQ